MTVFVPVSFDDLSDPELMKVEGKPLSIEIGDTEFEPTFVSDATLEISGDNKAQMDQCGHTEVHRRGSAGWTLTVEGIVTNDEYDTLKYVGSITNSAFVTSDLHTGEMVPQDLSVTQTDELNYLHVPQRGGIERVGSAYEFQLGLKAQQSDAVKDAEEENSAPTETFGPSSHVI